MSRRRAETGAADGNAKLFRFLGRERQGLDYWDGE
jgi:hypothetical protein